MVITFGKDMKNTERTPGSIDSVNVLLEECILAYPVSSFVISLYQQYQKRGSLSKKQLQGLYQKAQNIPDLAPGKLAAVELIIKKMPTRNKYEAPVARPLYTPNPEAEAMLDALLRAYPQHKRVLFLRNKLMDNHPLSAPETDEIKRLTKILIEKSGKSG